MLRDIGNGAGFPRVFLWLKTFMLLCANVSWILILMKLSLKFLWDCCETTQSTKLGSRHTVKGLSNAFGPDSWLNDSCSFLWNKRRTFFMRERTEISYWLLFKFINNIWKTSGTFFFNHTHKKHWAWQKYFLFPTMLSHVIKCPPARV